MDCRPHGPEPCALAELSHAPKADIISFRYKDDKEANSDQSSLSLTEKVQIYRHKKHKVHKIIL